MANVKTAVSLEAELFDQAEALARQMKMTRSGLYSSAISEYLARHKRERLLKEINAACEGGMDESERETLAAMQAYQARLFRREEDAAAPSDVVDAE